MHPVRWILGVGALGLMAVGAGCARAERTNSEYSIRFERMPLATQRKTVYAVYIRFNFEASTTGKFNSPREGGGAAPGYRAHLYAAEGVLLNAASGGPVGWTEIGTSDKAGSRRWNADIDIQVTEADLKENSNEGVLSGIVILQIWDKFGHNTVRQFEYSVRLE